MDKSSAPSVRRQISSACSISEEAFPVSVPEPVWLMAYSSLSASVTDTRDSREAISDSD